MSAALLSQLRALHPVDTIVHLDFEAFYSADFSLSKLTTEGYVRDPRFEAIGVGIQIDRGEPVWLEEWEFREWAKSVDWSRCVVNAHHTQLDAFILSQRYDIHPGLLTCTLSMARALHNGDLDLSSLGQRYGLGSKSEGLADVKGKRRSDMTQAEWRKFGDYCKQDVKLAAGLFYAMKKQLPPLEFWSVDTTIQMFTEPVFEGDRAVLDIALAEEKLKKQQMIAQILQWAGADPNAKTPGPRSKKAPPTPEETAKKVLGSNDKFAALLISLGESPPEKFNPKGRTIYAFAKDDPGMQELLESPREEIRLLAEARLSVKSNTVLTRVERTIGMASRGRMPVYLKYCGAHTHRWSGGDKSNWQNLKRAQPATKTKPAVPSRMRDAVLAPEGFVNVVVDSSQVEVRVAGWFAGEQGLLESFKRNDLKTAEYNRAFAERVEALGHAPSKAETKELNKLLVALGITEGDFYSDEGSKFFLMQISKSETPTERQISKNMLLGLQFSMGWSTYATNLLAGMLGSDPVQFTAADATRFGVDVPAFEARKYGWDEGKTCGDQVRTMITNGARLPFDALLIHSAVADHFTRRYRKTYTRIAMAWRTAEKVIEVMARELEDGETDDTVRMEWGCLKVVHRGLLKPNGMTLHYPQLRRSGNGFTYLGGKSGRERVNVYGGLLFENVVQSLARDIVAEQMLRIRADGRKIGTCTHDEAVAVVPAEIGQLVLDQALAHFRTPPAWCADLPLNAEGGFARSYGAA